MPLLRAPQPHKITLIVALVWLVFALAFGLHAWQASREDLVRQLRTVAELAEKSTDRYFEQLQAALSELAEEVVERDRLGELADVQRQLVRFKDRHPELIAASLLDTRGQFLATSTTTRLVGLPSVADQRDFAATLAALRHDVPMELTRPLFGPASGRWILPIRYTVRAPDGTVLGFLVASAPVEMLHAFWSQAPAMAKATIALVREDATETTRKVAETLGGDVKRLDVQVDTFRYDAGIAALFAVGLGVMFVNVLVGGLLTLAAPVLALVLRDRIDAEYKQRAKELAPDVVRQAAEKAAPKLDEMIDDFANRLDAWVVNAGEELHREVLEVLTSARTQREAGEKDESQVLAEVEAQQKLLDEAVANVETLRKGLWQTEKVRVAEVAPKAEAQEAPAPPA